MKRSPPGEWRRNGHATNESARRAGARCTGEHQNNDGRNGRAAHGREAGIFLARHEPTAGIGVHVGQVVEGLLGTLGVNFYDAIGDTVNTAKRIEGTAQGGEVLVSSDAISDIASPPALGVARRVTVKGKEKDIEVFPLLD